MLDGFLEFIDGMSESSKTPSQPSDQPSSNASGSAIRGVKMTMTQISTTG